MIILKKKKAIILRVPKTGSTSLEASIRFSGCLDDGDIASPIGDAGLPAINQPDLYESKLKKKTQLRRSVRKKRMENREDDLTAEELAEVKVAINNRKFNRFDDIGLVHGTVDDLSDPNFFGEGGLIKIEDAPKYTAYGFIRNPLKRAISGYFFSKVGGTPPHIEEFHEMALNGGFTGLVFRSQSDYFRNDYGIPVVPMVFENYEQELSSLISKLGGKPLAEYPKFKGGGASKSVGASVEEWIEPYPEVKLAIIDRYAEDVVLWEAAAGRPL